MQKFANKQHGLGIATSFQGSSLFPPPLLWKDHGCNGLQASQNLKYFKKPNRGRGPSIKFSHRLFDREGETLKMHLIFSPTDRI